MILSAGETYGACTLYFEVNQGASIAAEEGRTEGEKL